MNEFVVSLLGALTATAAGLAVAYWCARWFRLEQQRSLEAFRQNMRTLVEEASGDGLALPDEVQKRADDYKQQQYGREEISRGARRTESRPV